MAERVRPPLLVAPSGPPGPLVETGVGGPGGVLRSVLRDGPVSRGGLARSTGLSAASVSRYTAELIALGLPVELLHASPAPVELLHASTSAR